MCSECCYTHNSTPCPAHTNRRQRIQHQAKAAIDAKAPVLDLSYMHMTACPSIIGEGALFVTCLNISNNELDEVPEIVGNLVSCEEFFCQYNKLTCLPEPIASLNKLVELDAKNNLLMQLPAQIGNLQHLTRLSLTNNRLECLPESFGNLLSLRELSLYCNDLSSLPSSFGQLENLEVLYLGQNRNLNALPDDIGNLKCLVDLDASECALLQIPSSLARCRHLRRLWLSENRIREVPDLTSMLALTDLFLQLYNFNVQGNPMYESPADLPPDIVPKPKLEDTLVELCGRFVVEKRLAWRALLTPMVQQLLSQASHCALCGKVVITCMSVEVRFEVVASYHRVPLLVKICNRKHVRINAPLPVQQAQRPWRHELDHDAIFDPMEIMLY